MITFNEAFDIVNSTSIRVKSESVSVLDAIDRISYRDSVSKSDYPAENNSAMDGYALNSGITSKVSAEGLKLDINNNVIYAGDTSKKSVSERVAVKIMTGGYMPEELDAVIPVENANISGNNLVITSPINPNKNVRRKGEDIKRGDVILSKNTKLTPETIALLVSCNIKKIEVYEKIPVSIISTGNEILSFNQKLRYGKIYNSNGIIAENFLSKNGCNIAKNAVCKDNLSDIKNSLLSAIENSKIIITSAGASFGDKDFIEEALNSLGFKIKFRQVKIKPAKPFSFGIIKKIPVFILPGNPMAFYTCLVVFVRQFIDNLLNADKPAHIIKSKSSFEYTKTNKRREFIPARFYYKNGSIYSEIYKKHGSAMISSLGYMNSIVSIPEDISEVHSDDLLDTYLI